MMTGKPNKKANFVAFGSAMFRKLGCFSVRNHFFLFVIVASSTITGLVLFILSNDSCFLCSRAGNSHVIQKDSFHISRQIHVGQDQIRIAGRIRIVDVDESTTQTQQRQTDAKTTTTTTTTMEVDSTNENSEQLFENRNELDPDYYDNEGENCSLAHSLFHSSVDKVESVTAYKLDSKTCQTVAEPLTMNSQRWMAPLFQNYTPELRCLNNSDLPKNGEEVRCSAIKGRRVLINYAGNLCCTRSQPKNCDTGIRIGGFDVCLAFNEKSIDAAFAEKNCRSLSHSRGAGLWVWKPYIVYRTLLALDDGDVVFYADSGSEFVANIERTLLCAQAKLKQDIVVFSVGLPEREFTKEDAFQLIGCTSDYCRNTWQRSGSFSVFRKSQLSMRFVSEWLTYVQDYRIVSDEPSISNFEETDKVNHRNDQSILSLLSKKWKLDVWPDPSQWGNRDDDENSKSIKSLERFKFMQNKHYILHTRNLF